MAELMVDKLTEIQPDTDIVLVSGDFVSHGYAVKRGSEEDHYDELKVALHDVFVDLLGTRFPNSIILPAIGNNDIRFHYIAPRQDEEAADYYSFLSNMLFTEVPGNSGVNRRQIDRTFKKYGYYRYDIHPTCDGETCLSIISFNSLYNSLNRPRDSEEDIAQAQLEWLYDNLETAEEGRKFIVFMHIYPGQYQVFQETYFWDDSTTEKFINIMEMHSEKIMMTLGAHTHYSDLRVNIPYTENSDEEPVAKFSMLATPSFSLSNYNNPGFTRFVVRNNTVQDLKLTFMNAHHFPQEPKNARFNELDYKKDLGLETWTHKNVQDVIKNTLENNWSLFMRYLGWKVGFQGLISMYGVFIHRLLGSVGIFSSPIFFCASRHVNKVDFHKCLGK